MVRIKISYEQPEELAQVMDRLGPEVKNWKRAKQKGRFKRAYVELKEEAKNLRKPEANPCEENCSYS